MNALVANNLIEINRLLFSAKSKNWKFIGIFDIEFENQGIRNFCNKNIRFEFNFKYNNKNVVICEDCSKGLLNT